MQTFLTTALLLSLWLTPTLPTVNVFDAQERAREIAALFNKSKHKVKEKRGIRVDVYLEVTNEPAARSDAREYTGTYEAFSDYPFTLQVNTDGTIIASGVEPAPNGQRRFTLRDAKIEGALLTATKVYDDGATEKFEGVFLNRTVKNSPTDAGSTMFGLGVFYDPPKTSAGGSFSLNKLFYELKR